MGKRLTYPFEQVVKFFKRLSRTTEWVVKFFKQLTRTGKQLTYPFERLIKISERVHQTTQQLTLTIISKRSHFTTGRPVYSGMKLLFRSYPQLSTITTVCKHASLFWDCNFSKNYIGKTSLLR